MNDINLYDKDTPIMSFSLPDGDIRESIYRSSLCITVKPYDDEFAGVYSNLPGQENKPFHLIKYFEMTPGEVQEEAKRVSMKKFR